MTRVYEVESYVVRRDSDRQLVTEMRGPRAGKPVLYGDRPEAERMARMVDGYVEKTIRSELA